VDDLAGGGPSPGAHSHAISTSNESDPLDESGRISDEL
jgi:hypothetical protein